MKDGPGPLSLLLLVQVLPDETGHASGLRTQRRGVRVHISRHGEHGSGTSSSAVVISTRTGKKVAPESPPR